MHLDRKEGGTKREVARVRARECIVDQWRAFCVFAFGGGGEVGVGFLTMFCGGIIDLAEATDARGGAERDAPMILPLLRCAASWALLVSSPVALKFDRVRC